MKAHNEQNRPADQAVATTVQAEKSLSGTVADAWAGDRDVTAAEIDDRYVIDKEIGRGGLGRVVQAHDSWLGRTVALKEQLSGHDGNQVRFRREAMITARLQHPAIVPVYEASRSATGKLFYSMKMVAGQPLHEAIVGCTSLQERLGLLRNVIAVGEAIAYAHGQRIIHRDLKPANVMVGEFGETVVIDWGLAKDLDEPSGSIEAQPGPFRAAPDGLTIPGTVMGTPAYSAPEQLRGEAVTERADIYALGAILYEVLAGTPPYDKSGGHATLAVALARGPMSLAERAPDVPADLAAIVSRAMARDPVRRYATAKQMVDDLIRFESGQRVAVYNYSSSALFRRWIAKHKNSVAVALVALLALAVFGFLSVRRIVQEEREAHRQRRQAEQDRNRVTLIQAGSAAATSGTAALAWLKNVKVDAGNILAARRVAQRALFEGAAAHVFAPEVASSHALSADGRWLAVAWSGDRVLLFGLHSGAVHWLQSACERLRMQFLSSGASLVVSCLGGPVRIYEAQAPFGWREISFHTETAELLALSPDGRWLVTAGAGQQLRQWELSSGTLRTTASALINDVVFSPSGERFAAVVNDGSLRVWNSATGEQTIIGSHGAEPYSLSFSPTGNSIASVDAAGMLHVWHLDDGNHQQFAAHSPSAAGVSCARSGARIATSGMDGLIKVWTGSSDVGEVVASHPGGAYHVAFDPSGEVIASTGYDGVVRLSRGAGQRVADLRGHQGLVSSLEVGSRYVVSGDEEKHVHVWHRPPPDGLVVLRHAASVFDLAMSPDGRYLASAGTDGKLGVFDSKSRTTRVLVHDTQELVAVDFSPDGHTLLSGTKDGGLSLWDVETAQSRRLVRHGVELFRASFTQDSKHVALIDYHGGLEVWSTEGTRIATAGAEERGFWDVVSPAGGPALIAAGVEGVVGLWQQLDARPTTIDNDGIQIVNIDASPTGQLLAWCDSNARLTTWSMADQTKQILSAPCQGGRNVEFSTGEDRIVVPGPDFHVRVVTLATGATQTLTGHTAELWRVRFAPDGRHVVSASADGTIRVWNLATGTDHLLLGHEGAVRRLLFTPDGKTLVSASVDGTVRIWQHPFADPVPTSVDGMQDWLTHITTTTIGPNGELLPTPVQPPTLSTKSAADHNRAHQ